MFWLFGKETKEMQKLYKEGYFDEPSMTLSGEEECLLDGTAEKMMKKNIYNNRSIMFNWNNIRFINIFFEVKNV